MGNERREISLRTDNGVRFWVTREPKSLAPCSPALLLLAVCATNHGTTREMLRERDAPAPAAAREPQERSPFPPRAELGVSELLRLAPGFLRHPSAARVLLATRVLLCRRGQLPFCCPRHDLDRSRVATRVLCRLRRPPLLAARARPRAHDCFPCVRPQVDEELPSLTYPGRRVHASSRRLAARSH